MYSDDGEDAPRKHRVQRLRPRSLRRSLYTPERRHRLHHHQHQHQEQPHRRRTSLVVSGGHGPVVFSPSRAPQVPLPSPRKLHAALTLTELHEVFREHPELEQKYLNMMKLPITGKEPIQLPFSFHGHRQHTCVDLSPYGNDQVCKSACMRCRDSKVAYPTASDAMVAFINQASNIMRNRKFYYGFRKDMELLKRSANQPQLFQIYHIISAAVPEVTPLIFLENGHLCMFVVFEQQSVHVPCDCIDQILSVAKDGYSVALDILQGYIIMSVRCRRQICSTVKIDVALLQRKADELEIPNDVNEQFERYKALFDEDQ